MNECMHEYATTHNMVSSSTLLQMNVRDQQDFSQGSSSNISSVCQHVLFHIQQGEALRAVSNSIVSKRYSMCAFNVIMCDPWQVLDGVTVEAGEQAASRNLYAGRLTLDSLVERVGHSHFERLREMDLSGLKELGDVFTKEEGHFTGIQMLTLDNNELTEVSLC